MATISTKCFKPRYGTKEAFENIIRKNNPNLINIKEIWMDKETGTTYFIINEDKQKDIIDFSNNLFYNNNIEIEDNIFLNDIDPIWKMKSFEN